jgi:hypothetical protein
VSALVGAAGTYAFINRSTLTERYEQLKKYVAVSVANVSSNIVPIYNRLTFQTTERKIAKAKKRMIAYCKNASSPSLSIDDINLLSSYLTPRIRESLRLRHTKITLEPGVTITIVPNAFTSPTSTNRTYVYVVVSLGDKNRIDIEFTHICGTDVFRMKDGVYVFSEEVKTRPIDFLHNHINNVNDFICNYNEYTHTAQESFLPIRIKPTQKYTTVSDAYSGEERNQVNVIARKKFAADASRFAFYRLSKIVSYDVIMRLAKLHVTDNMLFYLDRTTHLPCVRKNFAKPATVVDMPFVPLVNTYLQIFKYVRDDKKLVNAFANQSQLDSCTEKNIYDLYGNTLENPWNPPCEWDDTNFLEQCVKRAIGANSGINTGALLAPGCLYEPAPMYLRSTPNTSNRNVGWAVYIPSNESVTRYVLSKYRDFNHRDEQFKHSAWQQMLPTIERHLAMTPSEKLECVKEAIANLKVGNSHISLDENNCVNITADEIPRDFISQFAFDVKVVSATSHSSIPASGWIKLF